MTPCKNMDNYFTVASEISYNTEINTQKYFISDRGPDYFMILNH